jgi:magnesium-transporting ATPase (P-type)
MSSKSLVLDHALNTFTTILPILCLVAVLLVWVLFYFKKVNEQMLFKIISGSVFIIVSLVLANVLKPFWLGE